MSRNSPAAMETRVTVLEGSVQRLETAIEGGRSEARQGLSAVQSSVERLITESAKREGATPQKTNWFAFASMGAAVFAVVTAIFSLAEWRVATATAPIIDRAMVHERTIRDLNEKALNLRVDLEKERAVRDYIDRMSRTTAATRN